MGRAWRLCAAAAVIAAILPLAAASGDLCERKNWFRPRNVLYKACWDLSRWVQEAHTAVFDDQEDTPTD